MLFIKEKRAGGPREERSPCMTKDMKKGSVKMITYENLNWGEITDPHGSLGPLNIFTTI
jgi:hypothetical protein